MTTEKKDMIELMKRHLGKPVEVTIGGGDTILLAPLGIDDIPDLVEVQFDMASSVKKGKGETDWTIKIPKETSEKAVGLIKKSLIKANPDLKDSESLVDEFIASNFMRLVTKLITLNTLVSERGKKKEETLAKIKEKVGNEFNPKAPKGAEEK